MAMELLCVTKVLFLFATLQIQQIASHSNDLCNVTPQWLNRTGRSFYDGQPWPQGVVKYELHHTLTTQDLQAVKQAMTEIQSKTCIRFQRRSPGERAYTSIEVDNNVCGIGHMCYQHGTASFAKFGGVCRNVETMIHELGHNLCLAHEHERKDRDEYLHYTNCPSNQIPQKLYETRGTLFDYNSQMHYACGHCDRGAPRMPGVSKCGPQVTSGLSVMDADRINGLYNCGGCLSHRWYSIESISHANRKNLLGVGENNYYICRGYVTGGHIALGWYSSETRTCSLPNDRGEVHGLTRKAEVLGVPAHATKGSYSLDGTGAKRIPAGRRVDGITGYAAVATVQQNGKNETVIGTVWENDLKRALIPFGKKAISTGSFKFFTCG